MFVKERRSGDLLRIKEIERLVSPLETDVIGRLQAGEEEQDEERFAKAELVFPSGEALPRCWTDPAYQTHRTETESLAK